MSFFVNDTNLTLCLWILGSVAVAVALMLLSVFDGKRDELRENVIFPEGSFTAAITDALIGPQERLRKLENRLNSKSARLEISQGKIEETKRSISELEVTSEEVQVKYQELLKQLKAELMKTELECQHLHNQIEKITTKRDKLKQELDEVSRGKSSTTLDDDGFIYETQIGKTYSYGQDTKADQSKRAKGWDSSHEKFTNMVKGVNSDDL